MTPEEIEQASMAIIAKEMGEWDGAEDALPVVKRVVHATADFDFVRALRFSEGAVERGREALRRGAAVVTDTAMAAAGISRTATARWNVPVVCHMAEPEVREEAEMRGTTRAVISVERAVLETPDAVFAIGNAPTALLRLCELIRHGLARPSLVIGVPVGFVNVVEAKEALAALDVPQIVAMGRKGGSTVAAAIVNALLYGMGERG
ncbi:MAG: precorrin-8X methylmutase [Fretibacterium sp.]|nr:precorrin-8X methylmutase [Fretibacterium sp.]